MWAGLKQEFAGTLAFEMVDRDTKEGDAFAQSHGILYQPGFVVIGADGMTLWEDLGPFEAAGLRVLIEQAADESL